MHIIFGFTVKEIKTILEGKEQYMELTILLNDAVSSIQNLEDYYLN